MNKADKHLNLISEIHLWAHSLLVTNVLSFSYPSPNKPFPGIRTIGHSFDLHSFGTTIKKSINWLDIFKELLTNYHPSIFSQNK